jgi:hypothetical protein
MANFNLADYETVEERLARFLKDHPDARIITDNLTTPADRSVNMWVVKTTIYLTDADQERQLPKATGHAFEIDGVNGMANKTSALENCETSSIGRALANAGYSGNRRATREEMAKVERGQTPKAAMNWSELLESVTTRDEARALYDQARQAKAAQAVLDAIKAKGESLA